MMRRNDCEPFGAGTNESGSAFLSFKIGPVQEFIECARSIRDLRTGSNILSALSYTALRSVQDNSGEIVFPRIQAGSESRRGVPHVFLAVVPDDRADEIAILCEKAARREWKRITDAAHGRIDSALRTLCRNWDRRWSDQVETYFEVQTVVLPWNAYGENELSHLLGHRDLGSPRGDGDLWSARVELAGRIMEAIRQIRPAKPTVGNSAHYPPKCSLMGSYEQMGPDGLAESREFWAKVQESLRIEGARLRKGERFSAIPLVKRFAGPVCPSTDLGHNAGSQEDRIPDTATVAAADWLQSSDIRPEAIRSWSGQWLHWPTQDFDRDEEKVPNALWSQIVMQRSSSVAGPPPAYYAILVMDCDHMGKWITGQMNTEEKGGSLQRLISEALIEFAAQSAPEIVRESRGTLVYSGGDDVLALLPTVTALECADSLRTAYAEVMREKVGEPTATISAGLAVVHYKEDLRSALAWGRAAEKEVKSRGRNAIGLSICRRSGEHSMSLCDWDSLGFVKDWITAFVNGASDRWAYHLLAELPALEGPEASAEMIAAEIRRLVDRSEKQTKELLAPDEPARAGHRTAQLYEEYLKRMQGRASPDAVGTRGEIVGRATRDFVTLAQSASFLARGRDR